MTRATVRPSADSTRKSILKAARKLFVKKGFAATSISEIAGLAAINQSLIYHHFENKQGLWKAVKQQAIQNFQQKQHISFEKMLGLDDCQQFLSALINYRFDIYNKHPDLRRMIDWQFMESSPHALRSIPENILDQFCQKIKNFQDQGVINSDFPAELVLTYLLQSPLGYFRSYKDLSKGLSKEQQEKRKKQYRQLCLQIATEGII